MAVFLAILRNIHLIANVVAMETKLEFWIKHILLALSTAPDTKILFRPNNKH